MGSNRDFLRWSSVTNATAYRVWRGPILGGGSILINLIDSTAATQYVDSTGLIPGTIYLYVVESKNTTLSPAYSPFSYAIVLRPHALGRLDSAVATGPQQVMAYYSLPMHSSPEVAPYITVNDTILCATVNSAGDFNHRMLLSFDQPFALGTNTLRMGPEILDADRAPLDSAFRTASFSYAPSDSEKAFFTHWEIRTPSQAQIWFNLPMNNDVLAASLYDLEPKGRVSEVEFADGSQNSILVTISEAAFGALGYPVSVILNGGTAQNGAPMMEASGNVATFSASQEDLTSAFVYPNPYRRHTEFDGIRFANLTQTATVHVYSASGKKVITLEESNGDGGLEWNMVDIWGDRIAPGVYLFRVEAEGLEDFVGKFEVLE
jgi:hypothetical protein